MSLKKILRVSLILLLMFPLSSCMKYLYYRGITIGQEIPEEFRKDEHVVIIIESEFDRQYNRKVKKFFARKYEGKFEVVSAQDTGFHGQTLHDRQKWEQEKLKKRYYFCKSETMIDNSNVPNRNSNRYVFTYRFYMVDRITGHHYSQSFTSSLYKKVLKAYIKRMNET